MQRWLNSLRNDLNQQSFVEIVYDNSEPVIEAQVTQLSKTKKVNYATEVPTMRIEEQKYQGGKAWVNLNNREPLRKHYVHKTLATVHGQPINIGPQTIEFDTTH